VGIFSSAALSLLSSVPMSYSVALAGQCLDYIARCSRHTYSACGVRRFLGIATGTGVVLRTQAKHHVLELTCWGVKALRGISFASLTRFLLEAERFPRTLSHCEEALIVCASTRAVSTSEHKNRIFKMKLRCRVDEDSKRC
jgi:hypothetical protein